MILVSACLLGVRCRYDGASKPDERAIALFRSGGAIPVCPEQLGGLTTPRVPCEIAAGSGEDVLDGRARVVDAQSVDRSAAFVRGAEETLRIAQAAGIVSAWLKSKSPSCGCAAIYDGRFAETLRPGDGVTTALLKRHGIDVRQEW